MHLLLIANYPPDDQRSMLRYSALLERLLPDLGCDVELVAPRPVLGRLRAARAGLGKWLGHADKLVLFPRVLRARAARARSAGDLPFAHVCDHSNSLYLRCVRGLPSLITVHDLLAIRRARGEFAGETVAWKGRWHQRMIRRALGQARNAICDSAATCRDFERLIGRPPGVFRQVPVPLDPVYANALASGRGARGGSDRDNAEGSRYVLHVGSGAWYKNREGLVEAYARLAAALPDAPQLRLVGPPLDPALRARVESAGLADRVRVLSDVSDAQLRDLYSGAQCLLFPSLEEGFGWPIVEAHACGCPVIASGREPMTEVGGDAALYVDPARPAEMAQAILDVLRRGPAEKTEWCERARRNAARYAPEKVLPQLVDVYRTILSPNPP